MDPRTVSGTDETVTAANQVAPRFTFFFFLARGDQKKEEKYRVLAESTFSVDYIMPHQTTRIMQQYGYCVTSLSSQAIQYDREAKVKLLQARVHNA
ncbi:unnamed protein product [Musa hybrid cultivar]